MLPEIEVRLEEIGLEADGALVERLRFDELVPAVVDVRQVDQRRDEIRIEFERLPVRGGGLLELGLVAVVERRAGAEVFFGERRVALALGCRARAAPAGASTRTLKREDLRRRRVEPEIERQLALTGRDEAAGDRAERRVAGELVVGLLDDRQIAEREERVGVGAHDRLDDAALHQIAQVILAKQPVARQQIARRVILLPQRLHGRHAGQPAELLLGDDRGCGAPSAFSSSARLSLLLFGSGSS